MRCICYGQSTLFCGARSDPLEARASGGNAEGLKCGAEVLHGAFDAGVARSRRTNCSGYRPAFVPLLSQHCRVNCLN